MTRCKRLRQLGGSLETPMTRSFPLSSWLAIALRGASDSCSPRRERSCREDSGVRMQAVAATRNSLPTRSSRRQSLPLSVASPSASSTRPLSRREVFSRLRCASPPSSLFAVEAPISALIDVAPLAALRMRGRRASASLREDPSSLQRSRDGGARPKSIESLRRHAIGRKVGASATRLRDEAASSLGELDSA